MATLTLRTFTDGGFQIEEAGTLPPLPQKKYYRIPHDIERVNVSNDQLEYITGTNKGRVRQVVLNRHEPLPEVYRLNPDHHVILDCYWQKVWRELNPALSDKKFCTLFGSALAWCNNSGFPGRRNCILNEDLDAQFPRFDQARICGGAIVTGIEKNGLLLIDTLRVDRLVTAQEIIADKTKWYYGTSISPRGQINYILRLGMDGNYHRVRIPILTAQLAALPLNHLHKLPDGLFPAPTWTHYN